jgi:hypothetical protein
MLFIKRARPSRGPIIWVMIFQKPDGSLYWQDWAYGYTFLKKGYQVVKTALHTNEWFLVFDDYRHIIDGRFKIGSLPFTILK